MTRAERAAPNRLELILHPDLADLQTLAQFAQREKACCQFFDFSFQVEPDAIVLVIGVPHDGAKLLDDFATLTVPGIRG